MGSYKPGVYQHNVTVKVENGKLSGIRPAKAPRLDIVKKSKEAFKAMIEANDMEAEIVTKTTWKIQVYNVLSKK